MAPFRFIYFIVLVLVGGVVVFGTASWAGLIIKSQSLESTLIAWGGGHSYVINLKLPKLVVSELFKIDSDDVAGDYQKTLASKLTLIEDGKPLGPAHALESIIRQKGDGAFSHQNGIGLLFSTSDNSDPRSNGRHYVVRYPIELAPHLTQDALVLFLVLLLPWVERRLHPGKRLWAHLKRSDETGSTGPAWAALATTILVYGVVQVAYVLTHDGQTPVLVGQDGSLLLTVIKDIREWASPFTIHVPVPMGGLFDLLPVLTNVWLNPGWLVYLLLGEPWGLVLAQLVFAAGYLVVAYALARAVRLPPVWAVLAAQLLLLLTEPPYPYSSSFSGFWGDPGLALICTLMTAVLVVAVRVSESDRPTGRQVIGAAILIAALCAGTIILESLWLPIFVFGMAPLFLPFVLSRNPRALAGRLGVFALALLILVACGLPDYVATLVKYFARESFSTEIHSEVQNFAFAGVLYKLDPIYFLFLVGWLAALFGSPSLLQRRLGLACLIQGVVALLYGAMFLFAGISWAGVPLPYYLDLTVIPVWVVAAMAGWRVLLELGVVRIGRVLHRARAWDGHAFAWPLVMVLMVELLWPCWPWLRTEMYYPPPGEPSPMMTVITDHLALHPGQPFQGAATVIIGVDDTPYDIWKFNIARGAAEVAFGPSFALPYLWSKGVPTLEEYGWVVTPQLYYVNSRLFSRSFDYQSRNLILPTRVDVRLFRAFGIRYVVTDRYSGAAIDPSARKMTIGGGAGAMELSLFELGHPNLGNYSPTRVIGVASGPRAIEAMGAPSFDPEHAVVALEPLPDGLVPARDGGFAPIRNGFHITATSDGWSLLLLPIQYSHCLGLEGGGSARIVRADLVLTGLLFQGSLDAVMRYGFGYWSTACRKADAEDMKRFEIKPDGTIKLPPFLNPHAVGHATGGL